MANPTFIKTRSAEGAIAAYSIVKPGANDYGVAQAAASTDSLLGITTELSATDGERCDVIMNGIAYVKLAGTAANGDAITSNGAGLGVKAAPGAGVNARVVGFAQQAGVTGDVIEVLLALGQIQG